MVGYERSYATGRSVSSVLELLGWLLFVIGALVAIVGFSTGGVFGVAQRGFGGRPDIFVRLIGSIPGFLLVWSGLLSIMFCQISKATLDSAEMQRELLKIARRDAPQVMTHGSEGEFGKKAAMAGVTISDNAIVEIKDRSGTKRRIWSTDDGRFATETLMGEVRTFSTLDEAKEYFA